MAKPIALGLTTRAKNYFLLLHGSRANERFVLRKSIPAMTDLLRFYCIQASSKQQQEWRYCLPMSTTMANSVPCSSHRATRAGTSDGIRLLAAVLRRHQRHPRQQRGHSGEPRHRAWVASGRGCQIKCPRRGRAIANRHPLDAWIV